jgi:hypothetical protein
MLGTFFFFSLQKKGVKWGINYNFFEETSMIFAAENVLREDVFGKI